MATWDVFHGDRLEVERSLDTEAVRQALARGELRDDDLIRPAGSAIPWARLADFPALLEPPAETGAPAALETPPPQGSAQAALEDQPPPLFADDLDEDEDEDEPNDSLLDAIGDEDRADVEEVEFEEADVEEDFDEAGLELIDDDLELAADESRIALPVTDQEWDHAVMGAEELDADFDPQDEDEAVAEFTLSRGSAQTVEELDLAAMVDVAFQLVLFFLVTATTVLYKSLEVPKPNPDSPAAAAAQGRSRSLDDLKNDYILVEIDPAGAMRIDREPVSADMNNLVERLREAREKTGRKAMLLTADFATPHRNAVLAYDAANEIGLGIAIARPSGSAPAPPAPPAARKAARG